VRRPGFMPQVLSPLVRRGWVGSDPGPTGGYSLRVAPEEISVLDVIEAIEGVTDTTNCVLADRPCSEQGPCSLHVPWSSARGDAPPAWPACPSRTSATPRAGRPRISRAPALTAG
jgi:Rrf2 family protein